MRVEVRLFAAAKEIVGQPIVWLDAPEHTTIATVRQLLVQSWPDLDLLVQRAMFAVDEEYAQDETALEPGQVVACIPPVSGG